MHCRGGLHAVSRGPIWDQRNSAERSLPAFNLLRRLTLCEVVENATLLYPEVRPRYSWAGRPTDRVFNVALCAIPKSLVQISEGFELSCHLDAGHPGGLEKSEVFRLPLAAYS